MPKIAVDIVLLPEEAMMDLAIAANAELAEKSNRKIILKKKDCLPHISLAMGCVEKENVTHIGEMLQTVVEIVPKRLKPAGIQKTTNYSGEVVSVLQIKRIDQLQTLHEKICDIVRPFFISDVSEDMMAKGRASASTLEWIRNYFINSAYEKFSPHITIGYGEFSGRPLPRDFNVSRLSICHLGNHCICVKILWSVEI